MFVFPFSMLSDSSSGSYTANGVVFDGTNDYLSYTSALTGESDTDKISVSFWYADQGGNSSEYMFVGVKSPYRYFNLKWSSNGSTCLIELYNSSKIKLLDGAFMIPSGTGWHHFILSIDLSNSLKRNIYIDDSALSVTWTSYTYGNIGVTTTDTHYIGGSSSTKVNAYLADFWLDFGSYLDITDSAVRRLFISATGKPVYLGATGNVPTGTAPTMFFSGATAGWETNLGTGGGFTENGALTTAPSSPSS